VKHAVVAIAKITAKGQTTVAQEVCAALHVAAGRFIGTLKDLARIGRRTYSIRSFSIRYRSAPKLVPSRLVTAVFVLARHLAHSCH
jgi:hypothetical protein